MQGTRRRATFAAGLLVAVLVVTAVLVAGCQPGGTPSKPAVQAPGRPVVPPPPMLRDPKSSVYSYLLWITYAYRIADSDVATMAFSPYEEVRVNSYVQLNKEQGRALDQTLTAIQFKAVRTQGPTATVGAHEEWRYRYIDMKTGRYNTDEFQAIYETTYTVVFYPDKKAWLVDSVEASATTPLQ